MRDKTGMKFGHLLVVEKTNMKKGSAFVYKCQCDCGNVLYTAHIGGASKTYSCGKCVMRIAGVEMRKDIGNRVIGKLRCSCDNPALVEAAKMLVELEDAISGAEERLADVAS